MASDKKGLETEISIPDKVVARIDGTTLHLKGPKGENKRNFNNPELKIRIKDSEITVSSIKNTRREKKLVYAILAHIRNMLKGVTEGHKYVLKICASPFPMNVAVSNNQIIIKNFIGEKYPRVLQLKAGATVKIDGDFINIESTEKEIAGTIASDIERLTKRPNFDPRIFQDGIYIINKDGKETK